ncbi:hypothetical protein CDL12_18680 [Handroanthus impetiginosus]|uniref:Uncharacterized protein n=1 Tax=Handroanthus impetiginosus TaxID=429701 RepID=A0A2G9GTY4_9LAMI|nr:hypothetical protein CDL12_18680 [Handroanthus impetiginosus]
MHLDNQQSTWFNWWNFLANSQIELCLINFGSGRMKSPNRKLIKLDKPNSRGYKLISSIWTRLFRIK